MTVPPYHPNCRGTTAPAIDPKYAGERAARNEDGEVYYVPANMTYTEWKKAFVDGGSKQDILQAFPLMGAYLDKSGTLNVGKIREDYKKFLQSAPEGNRIYLQQALDGVEFEEFVHASVLFGYLPSKDVMLYNPKNPLFNRYNLTTVLTHELAHRIDFTMFVESWENEAFSTAIKEARSIITDAPEKFLNFANNNDTNGFLSDILSALCEDNVRFRMYHEKEYWKKSGVKEQEIFANLFALESFDDETKIEFLRRNFPAVIQAYENLKP